MFLTAEDRPSGQIIQLRYFALIVIMKQRILDVRFHGNTNGSYDYVDREILIG